MVIAANVVTSSTKVKSFQHMGHTSNIYNIYIYIFIIIYDIIIALIGRATKWPACGNRPYTSFVHIYE